MVLRGSGIFQVVDRKTARVVRTVPVPGAEGTRVTAAGRIASRDYLAVGFEDGRAVVLAARLRVDFALQGRHLELRRAGRSAEVQTPARAARRSVFVAAAREDWGNLLLGSSGASDLTAAKLPGESEETDALPGAEPPQPVLEDLSERLAGARVTASRRRRDRVRRPSSRPTAGTFLPMSIDAEGTIAPADLLVVEPEDPRPDHGGGLRPRRAVGRLRGREGPRLVLVPRARAENPNLRLFRKIHVFDPMPAAVTAIGISTRNKCFVTADAKGDIWLRHNTTEKTLLRFAGRRARAIDAGIAAAGRRRSTRPPAMACSSTWAHLATRIPRRA